MRIAIIGAPTSGKSDLAKSMARALNKDSQTKFREDHPDVTYKGKIKTDWDWKVIDDYVADMAERTGHTYGPGAGYVENVSIMSYRWLLEDEMAKKGYNTISVGSIYETFTYAAMLNTDLPSDEQAMIAQRTVVTVMMNFFHLMEPAGRYDHVFFLPWQDREHEHSWHAVVNAKLPDILTASGVTATALTGTKRENLRDALKITRFIRDEIYNKQAQELAEQSAV